MRLAKLHDKGAQVGNVDTQDLYLSKLTVEMVQYDVKVVLGIASETLGVAY